MGGRPFRAILVIRPGAMGDVLLTLPVFGALRDSFPGAQLTWMGNGPLLGFLPERSPVDRAIGFDEPDASVLFQAEAAPPDSVQSWLVHQDLVLNYGGEPAGTLPQNLRRLFSGPVVHVDARPAAVARMPMREYLLAPLQQLGVASREQPGRITLTEGDQRQAHAWRQEHGVTGGLAVLHPGSGSQRKNWPAEGFVAVASWLQRSAGLQVLWLSGPADAEAAGAVKKALEDGPGLWLENAGLDLLAGVLATAALYVGNDSGISHLAAALGVSSVVIFGATDPLVWAPWGPHVRIVAAQARTTRAGEGDGFAAMPVGLVEIGSVIAACRDALGQP